MQRLCDMADDAYGHVGTGLSHLYKVQQHYYVAARKDRTRAAVTAAVVVLLMVVAYCRAYAVANEDDSGLPQTDHP